MRIVYIDIDSCRPDHLGCYGYHRNTSPAIDAIAAQGVRCDNVFASDAPCLPSRTAFYSGRFGIHTGVVGHSGTAAQIKIEGPSRGFRDSYVDQGLAFQLQKLGMHTAMISPFGQRHAAHWFYAGFKEIHNTGQNGFESAHHVEPVLKKWLADNIKNDNWYLHVNFWDPHTPFRVPDEYGEPFKNDPPPAWLDDDKVIARHRKKTGPHSAQDLGMYEPANPKRFPRETETLDSRAAMKKWIDGYDTGVKYVDDQVAYVVEQLKKAGIYDDTAIIISADHGENLGELGIYSEHGTADLGTCRIPMIIKWPGGAKGKVDAGLHYNLDWAPTIVDLLGAKRQPIWDGQSYASVIAGKPMAEEVKRDDLVISQCCHVCQRSVRWGKWLYMRTYHDGFHLFPAEMLYDVEADPHEQNDIAAQHPQVCHEGAWRLGRWHSQQMEKMALNGVDVVDPLWTVIKEGGPTHASHAPIARNPLPKYLKRLEETGRSDGAAALRKKYARFLPSEA